MRNMGSLMLLLFLVFGCQENPLDSQADSKKTEQQQPAGQDNEKTPPGQDKQENQTDQDKQTPPG